MAEKTLSDEVIPPPSSFRGRLDIHNFKFTAEDQPETHKTVTMTRCSERLSSKIHKSFKPTKHNVDSKKLSPGTKKRKAEDYQNTHLLETTSITSVLRGEADAESSSSEIPKPIQACTDRETSLSGRSEHLADVFWNHTHKTTSYLPT